MQRPETKKQTQRQQFQYLLLVRLCILYMHDIYLNMLVSKHNSWKIDNTSHIFICFTPSHYTFYIQFYWLNLFFTWLPQNISAHSSMVQYYLLPCSYLLWNISYYFSAGRFQGARSN